MEHRLERGGIKNWPKIKIDLYFFVKIEKKIKIAREKLKKKSKIRIKIEQKVNFEIIYKENQYNMSRYILRDKVYKKI